MNQQANVLSIDNLEGFKNALQRFHSAAEEALGRVQHETQCTLDWLAERRNHWRNEVQRRQQSLQRALEALARCHASGSSDRDGRYQPPDRRQQATKVREANAYLAEAQSALETAIRWSQAVEQAAGEYQAQARRLSSQLSNELPKATATMERQINSLRSYLFIPSPGGGTLITPAGSTYPLDPRTLKAETIENRRGEHQLGQQLSEANRYLDLARQAHTAGGVQGAPALESFHAIEAFCEALANFLGFRNYWRPSGDGNGDLSGESRESSAL